MPSYRSRQTERGLEAVKMLTEFIERVYGKLSVSIGEEHYSSGSYGRPDLVFRDFGIDAKRVELLTKHHYPLKEKYWAHLGNLKTPQKSWTDIKDWCERNHKIPMIVAVLTFGRQPPIFVKLGRELIDALASQDKKWIQMSVWQMLLKGEIWRE